MTKYDYSEEKVQFLKNNVKGILLKELTRRFNERFNCNLTENAIQNMKRQLNLTSDLDTKLKKGHIPHNKGKKWADFMSEQGKVNSSKTFFKKGHIPYNYRSIGEERVDTDGYILVKIQDGHLYKNWKLKHRVIWEEKNGPVPNGYHLIFADGNKQNFDLDNLVLVSNSELLLLNRNKLYKNNKELTKTAVNIVRLIDKANKRKEK